MLWFRLASGIFLIVVLIWTMGVVVGVVQMCSYGASTKSMIDDPTRNGTISVYVLVISVETFIFFCTLFGIFVAFRMWRNNYQIDHSLRHQFIIWLACWGIGFAFCLIIGIYMIIKSKDSQENMAVLYDTFFRNSQDQKFVATFEKFQREYQCCGIYTPNDWFIIQFRQRSGGVGGGGGGGGGFQDYDGYNQNPSTGKCHLQPPTLPPGCGTKLNDEIQFIMKIYAACAITQTIIGAFTGGLFWYCFFYWLEKEVIVIPEDEVSNLIIIEPESEATLIISSSSSILDSSGYLSSRSRVHVGSYLNKDSRYGSYLHGSRIGSSSIPSGMRTRNGSYLHRSSYLAHSPGRSHSHHHHEHEHEHDHEHHHHHHHPHKIHLSHTAILHEQEEALGGHVLAEMHVNHKSTKMLQAKGSNAGQHHATVALVRNKNPPPKNDLHLGRGHHGQTGNLARDIADMSGNSAKGYIEDVVIPPEVPGKKARAIQIPLGASVHSRSPTPSHSHTDIQKDVKANSMQDQLEGLMHIFSHDHQEKKKSHKSVVIERKDHHHHKKKPKLHDPEAELSEPRLLPPLGSHESALHNHHHHEHGNHNHHHGSQHHHHGMHLQHHGSHHHNHGSQHHGGGRVEHHHPHVDINGSIFGQNHIGSSSRHSHHHHGSRTGEHHHHDHQRYLHAGHEHHHHDRYPHNGGYHGHGRYSPTNTHHHHHHGRSPYHSRSKDFRYGTTTVLFKNPKNLDDSD